MTLGQLIERLKDENPKKILRLGFRNPHSYRGYYDQLAFEPKQLIMVEDMLKDAQSALGKTFEGYKGGEFKMSEHTDVWLAEYGNTSDEMLSHRLLSYMLNDSV